MHKCRPIKFWFDPEIKGSARRLRKEHRGLGSTTNMVDMQNLGDLNPHGGKNPINAQVDIHLPILDLVNAQGVQEGQNG